MNSLRASVAIASIAVSGPVIAGETVLYGAAPAWVVSADFAAAQAKGESLVLLDQQTRMEGGTTHNFTDVAYKLDSPEALTKGGTLQLGWLPDKGDLTVHRIKIYRDGKPIDVVAAGSRYTVLRREKSLEKRSLDGLLTATLAVPGLKLGDVLRFSQTVTLRDQALGDATQMITPLLAEPVKMGFGRIAVSWPRDVDIRWKVGGKGAAFEPVDADGYKTLTVTMPLAKQEEMPKDAPSRFTMGPLMQATSFTGWTDLSRRMAPHFATKGAITAGSPLAKQVAAIAATSTDPKTRMAAVLRLVQDDVAYLLNGLNGGNYLPQSPAETWENRFGDCKAKSLMLLAMLRELGIESEAVLVRSRDGDAVATMLPMASDFDHMIVRASVDGTDYWLDGTSLGTRIDTIDEVPPFAYALPLRPGGGELMPVAQRWPTAKDRVIDVTYDYRAGLDMPVLYDARLRLRGPLGAAVRERFAVKDNDARLKYAAEVLEDIVGDGIVYKADLAYDEDSGVGTVSVKGLLGTAFKFDRGRGSLALGLPSTNMTFAPDRARAAWRDIPVAVGGPYGALMNLTVLLPKDAGKLDFAGLTEFEGEVAGQKVRRTVTFAQDKLHIVDDLASIPGEIAAADFAQQRAAASKLATGDPILRTDPKPLRYWMLDPPTARARIATLEPAYGAIIALDPEQAWRWSTRAKLLQMGPDTARAAADYDKAIALEASAENFWSRSSLRRELGNLSGALADAHSAHDLEATAASARSVADILAQMGKAGEALALLDTFELSGDERVDLLLAKAEIMGEGGRGDEGWALLGELEAERPGDAKILNAQCWYMGNWAYRLETAGETCDRAVKAGSYNPAMLDSRALVHYRMGRRQEALSDLQAALIASPDQTTSLYLRGLIALDEGKREEGERDIAAATRLYGGIEQYFARFGMKRAK